MKNETKSYVVVEFGPDKRGIPGECSRGGPLKVFQYSLEIGADGGPASLKKHQKYEIQADEFGTRIHEIELELNSNYSDWKFKPAHGMLGSCGDHLKL